MTACEAHDEIAKAMDNLKSIRDALGAQLAKPGVEMSGETRQMSDLHDRVARAIQAYQ